MINRCAQRTYENFVIFVSFVVKFLLLLGVFARGCTNPTITH